MTKTDYYEILEVTRDADEQTLKSAYRKKAMQYHPDRNPGSADAEENFKLAAEAYGVLSDPEKRSVYDRFGHDGLARAGNGAAYDASAFTDFQDVFGDIFESFFGMGGGRSRNRVRKGEDLRFDLEISFEEAMHGKHVEISVPRMDPCGRCGGNGAEREDGLTTCPTCRGAGQVIYSQSFVQFRQTCGTCNGRGQIIRRPCKECRGQGFVRSDRKLKVNIPAGVDTGTQMRLSGEGQPSHNGGPHGDLYVVLRVREHPLFERQENDLLCTVPITVAQAALGCEIELNAFDGVETVKIPEGTQPGTRFRIRGRGVPRVNSSGRGDLIIRIEVRIPDKLNKSQRTLFEQLRDSLPEDNKPREKGIFEKVRDYFL